MKNKNKTGLAEIAKEAGVSVMTVYRALNDYPDISEETRHKIISIAKAKNYRPNYAARAMRSGKFGSVGLAMGPADLELAAVIGIFRILNQNGINLVFSEIPYASALPDKNYVPGFLRQNMVDGIILHAGIFDNPFMPEWLESPNIPSVIIIGNDKKNCIFPDFQSVIPKAFENLLKRGYKKIAYIGPTQAPFHHYSYEVHRIFKTWTKTHKKTEAFFIATDSSIPEQNWNSELSELISNQKNPIAFIAPSVFEARRCYALALANGKRVPDDLGILAFTTRRERSDSGIYFSGYMYSSYELGEEAARLLLNRIEKNGDSLPNVKIKLKYSEGQTLKQ